MKKQCADCGIATSEPLEFCEACQSHRNQQDHDHPVAFFISGDRDVAFCHGAGPSGTDFTGISRATRRRVAHALRTAATRVEGSDAHTPSTT